jgi:hypothetical protein
MTSESGFRDPPDALIEISARGQGPEPQQDQWFRDRREEECNTQVMRDSMPALPHNTGPSWGNGKHATVL